MKLRNILRRLKIDLFTPKRYKDLPKNLHIETTGFCNLNCEYCVLRENMDNKEIMGFSEFKAMLQQVDAPVAPMDIGIERDRLKKSYGLAQLIRKRYTILDFTKELGVFETCVNSIFNSGKYWM